MKYVCLRSDFACIYHTMSSNLPVHPGFAPTSSIASVSTVEHSKVQAHQSVPNVPALDCYGVTTTRFSGSKLPTDRASGRRFDGLWRFWTNVPSVDTAPTPIHPQRWITVHPCQAWMMRGAAWTPKWISARNWNGPCREFFQERLESGVCTQSLR